MNMWGTMSYNYFCNKQHFNEDGEDSPIWLDYSFDFRSKNLYQLNKKIEKFEKLHPNLKLVMVDDITKEKPVVDDTILFSDELQDYHELRYKFKIYGNRRYYEPDVLLLNWLLAVDMFALWLKVKRAEKLMMEAQGK